IYSKWFDEYARVDPSVRFNYQSIGSGGGIRQISEQTVDFGASDGPMTDEQLAKAPRPLLHVPTVLGAVVATYNLPGDPKLRFTPEILADIFLGKITSWNDPKIAEVNPGARLANTPIVVVHRSDGSGTTFIWVDYLSKSMPADFRVSLTNPSGDDAYPIASFTWLLVYKDQVDETKGRAVVKFLWWMSHEGQKYAPDLLYAPLPPQVAKQIEGALSQIT